MGTCFDGLWEGIQSDYPRPCFIRPFPYLGGSSGGLSAEWKNTDGQCYQVSSSGLPEKGHLLFRVLTIAISPHSHTEFLRKKS